MQALSCFSVNIAKVLRAAFSIEQLWWLFLQMFCFTLYFQKDIAKYIVVIHCVIVSFWNLKSLLLPFAFSRCATRCHSLYHSLSFFVSLAVILCHSFSFTVTRCHSLSLVVSHFHALYHSLSIVVLLVVTRSHSLSIVVTLCTNRLPLYERSFEYIFDVKVSKISSCLTHFLNHTSVSFKL